MIAPTGRRLLFIKPSTYDRAGQVLRGRKAFYPGRTLPYLAALTPPRFEVRILDEFTDPVTGDEEADLVALTGMLCNMPRAIDLGRLYRRRGVPTVIGGIGVFSLGEALAASGAFDAVVHGEAETIWPEVLADFEAGRLRPRYDAPRAEDLSGLPHARYDLVDLRRYHRAPGESQPFLGVETSRGCPHGCAFCAITLFHGRRIRFRPVGDVVEELRRLGARYYILTDDNIVGRPERARELFRAITPLGIRWAGQFEMGVVNHPDVLHLAAESGCRHAVVGVESLVEANLRGANKGQNVGVALEDLVEAFKGAGIALTASLIVGMDHDTPEVLDWTFERMIASGTDFILPWVLTPGPGSSVYDDLKREGRILHEDFSAYNGVDVVFEPKHMTPEVLAERYWSGLRRFYSLRHGLPRALRSPRRLDALGLGLYFWHTLRGGRHPFVGGRARDEGAG